ncbi:MAG: hypothetical protein DHS20C12_08620 [Pseudohongiella sp.]|nr:MAG: hypothetical protein DHS20C12_08620 [Pseudohongiella sp.]
MDVPRTTIQTMSLKGFGGKPLFTIDLPNDIEKRLLVLAMHKGRTVQYCAREAILDYIDEVEERFLAVEGIGEEDSVDEYGLLDESRGVG